MEVRGVGLFIARAGAGELPTAPLGQTGGEPLRIVLADAGEIPLLPAPHLRGFPRSGSPFLSTAWASGWREVKSDAWEAQVAPIGA